jgi:Putative Ig domain
MFIKSLSAELRIHPFAWCALVAVALAGCGGGATDSATAQSVTSAGSVASTSPPVINGTPPTGGPPVQSPAPPTISGKPAATVTAGETYTFTPAVTDPGHDRLTFSIVNRPAWATFSKTTGQLSGTPSTADVNSYSNIIISVSNGSATAALAAFSIRVTRIAPVNGACGSSNGIAVSSAPTTGLCSIGTASSVGGTGPWTWSCAGSDGGSTAQCSAPLHTGSIGTVTNLHYAPNGNFDSNGSYLPGADGFNLADVSDVGTLNSLPTGVMGLVWVGLCNGVDSTFTATIQPFIGNSNGPFILNPKLFGFYLMDEPDPTGQYAPLCTATNLMAESNWIHAHLPGAKTFIVMMNLGTPTQPTYANTYNPSNTDIDLFGLDPYPVRPQFTGGVDYSVINAGVSAAEAEGIPASKIVPVYQVFGGGGYSSYTLPTPAQEQQALSTWGSVVPNAAFDYAYSWGAQDGDQSLSTALDLQPIILQHNTNK